MAKVKVFQKYVKLQGQLQGHWVKNFGTHEMVLSQEMHMWNMKALPIVVHEL